MDWLFDGEVFDGITGLLVLIAVFFFVIPTLSRAQKRRRTDSGDTAVDSYYPWVYTIEQQHLGVIERFGKFHSVVQPGLHVRLPIVDRVRGVSLMVATQSMRFDAKTADNVTIKLEVNVQYRVDTKPAQTWAESGVYRSLYTLTDPVSQMKAYFADALRSEIPRLTLDSVFEEKETIARSIDNEVKAKMQAYGYEVITTLITSIILPEDVQSSMNRIVATKNDMQSAKNEAEANRSRVVVAAQAEAEAMETQGKGIAAQRRAIADGLAESLDVIRQSGLSAAEANLLLMFTQQIGMQEKFAENNGTKTVIVPSDFSNSGLFEQLLSAEEASQGN